MNGNRAEAARRLASRVIVGGMATACAIASCAREEAAAPVQSDAASAVATSSVQANSATSAAAVASGASLLSGAARSSLNGAPDLSTPMPAITLPAFDEVAKEVPGLAAHRAEFERIESALATRALRALAAKSGKRQASTWKSNAPSDEVMSVPVIAGRLASRLLSLVPAARAQSSADADFLLPMVGRQFVMVMQGAGESKVDPATAPETILLDGKEGQQAGQIKREAQADGSVSTTLTTTMNMPSLLLSAGSQIALTSGSMCPDDSGRVEFTARFKTDASAGSHGAAVFGRSVTAHVTAEVGDDAEVVSTHYEVEQSTRATRGGRQVYVESSGSVDAANGITDNATNGAIKVVRSSSQATSEDVAALSREGVQAGALLAVGMLMAAKSRWQNGACIRIEAHAPKAVRPGATSKINVSVKHKHDGTDVPAKVEAKLSGGASLDPTVVPRAPGDLTHVAPAKRGGGTISIELVASSRRGRAKQTLQIGMGQSYKIAGGGGELTLEGTICDIGEPFTINGSGVVMNFVPSADSGGTFNYNGSPMGIHAYGNGTYSVQFDGDKPSHLTAKGPGSVDTPMGTRTANGTWEFTISYSDDARCE